MANDQWQAALPRVLVRMEDTTRRVGVRFPHWANTDSGEWVTTADGDWTGGYWVGMNWIAHRVTGDKKYEARAQAACERLRPRIHADTVFRSFPLYYGAAVGAILGNQPAARAMALECAHAMVDSFDPALQLIALGRQAEEGSHIGTGETSIDSMQTATLLYWAAKVDNDAAMKKIAFHHADRILSLHLRADDSFIQSSSLDQTTGKLIRHYTHKGFSDSSTWGRAQAWGMIHAVMAFMHDPKQEQWLDAAVRGADWWIAHVPADKIAYWDFDDPAIPNTERDATATAIATSALLKLASAAPHGRRAEYQSFAEATATALINRCLTPTRAGDPRTPGTLTTCCFNKRTDARPHDAASNCEFIVGSYYMMESLAMLAGAIEPNLI
jgi:unsaturated chondroitin disaccharide hydrolase